MPKERVNWGAYTPLKARLRREEIALLKNAKLSKEAREMQAEDMVMGELNIRLKKWTRGEATEQQETHKELRILVSRMKRERLQGGIPKSETIIKYAGAFKKAIANDRHIIEIIQGLKHEKSLLAEWEASKLRKQYMRDIENLRDELGKVEKDIRRRQDRK
ncbi:MAG: hypothetical protein HYW05_01320 [Candidatus Diapherotrites archaeon]|nr:hypothetical protein [Candidatus Diapherotrites archaeon]